MEIASLHAGLRLDASRELLVSGKASIRAKLQVIDTNISCDSRGCLFQAPLSGERVEKGNNAGCPATDESYAREAHAHIPKNICRSHDPSRV